MSADESGDAAISWNYQKIPTRIAAAHPELVDTLPSPELQAGDGGRTKIVAKGGGGGVNSEAVRGVQRPGTCTPAPAPAAVGASGTSGKPKIAAVVTVYREGSHSDVLLGKFLPGRGIALDDGFHELRVELVGIYIDQIGSQGVDIGVPLAEQHGVPVYPSIRQALCCGGDQLAVDGVLMIGEHGDYPWNEKQQQIFPRKYFIEQICGVFTESGRAVPVFSDKHLSHSWDDATWMVNKMKELGAPFMAGSSMVTAWRRPYVEHPLVSAATLCQPSCHAV